MRRSALTLPLLTLAAAACGKPGDAAPWARQDEHAPVAAASCPADGDVAVSPGVRPRVLLTFPGEATPDLDPETLSAGSVTLVSSERFGLAGEVTWDPDTGVVRFAPRGPLHPYVRHELTVTGAVRDLLGNPVASELRAGFVTAEEDTGDPCAGWTGPETEEGEP